MFQSDAQMPPIKFGQMDQDENGTGRSHHLLRLNFEKKREDTYPVLLQFLPRSIINKFKHFICSSTVE